MFRTYYYVGALKKGESTLYKEKKICTALLTRVTMTGIIIETDMQVAVDDV